VRYNLVYTKRAVRDIKKLDITIKKRVGKILLRYKDKPLDYADTLKSSDLGTYRFRIGDYRVIFDIEKNDIVVLRVGHRREIYKKK
jgi:mRNA interferase RelE/StbE